ncbi:CorA Metal Ion Transporter (MIT) Family, partial [Trachipleistophora hominis]
VQITYKSERAWTGSKQRILEQRFLLGGPVHVIKRKKGMPIMASNSRNIAEIITIYRRMKKGRENQRVYRQMLNVMNEDENNERVDEYEMVVDTRAQTGTTAGTNATHTGNASGNVHRDEDSTLSTNPACVPGKDTNEQFLRSYETGNYWDDKNKDEGDSEGYNDRPSGRNGGVSLIGERQSNKFYNFERYQDVEQAKFLFYSKEAGMFQTDSFSEIETRAKGYYWLSIFDPAEKDLIDIGRYFKVHDITLNDIREKNTKEKVELFHNYTFISTRLFSERETRNANENEKIKSVDIDFNILMFRNFIVTLHDTRWNSISDILNFLNLISEYTTVYPEWVLFSIVVEFLQDVRFLLELIVPEVTAMQNNSYVVMDEIGGVLKENFLLTNSLFSLRTSTKPKIHILNNIINKYGRKLRRSVLKHIYFTYQDFLSLDKEMKENSKSLERCQDLFLALVNMEQSREGNEMNKVMKRFTIITFIFLPMQTVAGLWGMNVPVPFQDETKLWPFFLLCIVGPLISMVYFFTPRRLFHLFQNRHHKP